MRVIDVFTEPVHAVAASPDGQFLAACAGFLTRVIDWRSGEANVPFGFSFPINQAAFTATGDWLAIAYSNGLYRLNTVGAPSPVRCSSASYSGGIAIAPDGRSLAVTFTGQRQHSRLQRWELPAWRSVTGFDFWSPFGRLAFSPNGEFLAGINNDTFELRIAITGGLNGRQRTRYPGDGFFAFAPDSQTVAFGWATEFQVMETRAGAVIKRVTSPGEAFVDAVFIGSGQLLATVDRTPVMRLWSTDTWELAREYDWGAGRLTCLTASTDGLAGICGTDAGRLVVFDVDE